VRRFAAPKLVAARKLVAATVLFVATVLVAGTVPDAARAAPGAAPAAPARLHETPFFREAVASGALPKVADRLPSDPSVVDASGVQGNQLRVLMASPKDTRMMVVYGYARLVGYTPSLEIEPDILKALDVVDGRVFTLHLRNGMKWSDGQPFTTEDFRYWFEDVAKNPKLSPSGLPVELLPEGQPPRFEVLDATTVRYSWPIPNPLFLPALARADPLFIYCPAHYLKQFNKKYADKATLAALVKRMRVHNWAALHNRMNTMYRDNNPDLPTLDPWVLQTKPPSERFVFVRNPYYYRVDTTGHQLPYIDRVIMSIADSRLIPAKTAAGESDLQARYLSFDDYTFLRRNEERKHFKVRLWRSGPGSQLALYPNLNVNDPVWRRLLRDVRFRRALSLAINRHEINEVLYFGLAIEGQNTILPKSPLYDPAYRSAWAQYDLNEANHLLDQIGLKRRDGDADGVRLLPDGRPMEIVVEDSGEWPGSADVLELIHDSWRHIGIRLFTKPLQLTLFRQRVFSGETLMSIDKLGQCDLLALGICAHQPAAARMAQMGPVLRDQAQGRRAPGPARRRRSEKSLRRLARHRLARTEDRGLASDPAHLGRPGIFDGHGGRRASAGRGQRQSAQRSRKGHLELGSRRLFRHLQARPILVRHAAGGGEIGVRRRTRLGLSVSGRRCSACPAPRDRAGRRVGLARK
jgi:peptide/nickel transport system substrate-binding protein